MQTSNPELIRHMDARREQRELAAKWRIARTSRRGKTAAARTRGLGEPSRPAASGAAAILNA